MEKILRFKVRHLDEGGGVVSKTIDINVVTPMKLDLNNIVGVQMVEEQARIRMSKYWKVISCEYIMRPGDYYDWTEKTKKEAKKLGDEIKKQKKEAHKKKSRKVNK